jgi:hypothetical protein
MYVVFDLKYQNECQNNNPTDTKIKPIKIDEMEKRRAL